jgi:hypothetical protein
MTNASLTRWMFLATVLTLSGCESPPGGVITNLRPWKPLAGIENPAQCDAVVSRMEAELAPRVVDHVRFSAVEGERGMLVCALNEDGSSECGLLPDAVFGLFVEEPRTLSSGETVVRRLLATEGALIYLLESTDLRCVSGWTSFGEFEGDLFDVPEG